MGLRRGVRRALVNLIMRAALEQSEARDQPAEQQDGQPHSSKRRRTGDDLALPRGILIDMDGTLCTSVAHESGGNRVTPTTKLSQECIYKKKTEEIKQKQAINALNAEYKVEKLAQLERQANGTPLLVVATASRPDASLCSRKFLCQLTFLHST